MDLYPGVILWVFPDLERGGCLAACDDETYMFQPTKSRVCSRTEPTPFEVSSVYASGFFPEAGRMLNFTIEWGENFGRCGYRIPSMTPLLEKDANPEEWAVLKGIYQKHAEEEAMKKGFGPRTRSY